MNIEMNELEKEKHNNLFFTEYGLKTLKTYTQTLAKEYYQKKENEYPFKIGLVFGIPFYKYAHTFNSKEDLLGRIKAYSQLIGQKEITFKINNSEITIKLEGEQ